MKPVLDTSASDLDAPLAFSVKGPVTCVNAVLPGMRALGHGALVFVNGGSAVRPHPERAGTSIAFAAESACARMLHDTLAPENIHAAQLIIPGAIRPDAERGSPGVLAQRLYAIHTERNGFRHYAEPLPGCPRDDAHAPDRPSCPGPRRPGSRAPAGHDGLHREVPGLLVCGVLRRADAGRPTLGTSAKTRKSSRPSRRNSTSFRAPRSACRYCHRANQTSATNSPSPPPSP